METREDEPAVRRQSPADHFKAGKLAGLREAMLIAEKHREERLRARDEAKALKSPRTARDHESMAYQAGHIEASIRARIAALETEEGK